MISGHENQIRKKLPSGIVVVLTGRGKPRSQEMELFGACPGGIGYSRIDNMEDLRELNIHLTRFIKAEETGNGGG